MKHIWILDEGSQGHVVQSRGLVRELAKVVDLKVSEIPARLAVEQGIARSVVKKLLRRWHWDRLFHATHALGPIPDEKPDLILSSGPRSMLALEHLSRKYQCPSVFVQGTVVVPENLFTAVMRPFEGVHRSDFIFIPLLFTAITPEVVERARNEYLAEKTSRPSGPLNALFIGASSAKIRFSNDDWLSVIRMVNEAWKRDRRKWLITTSYRTGPELEGLLANGIDPQAIHDAVWYHQAPRKVTRVFLGMADRVFVTMDSLTMLTEAVASGRPTCALCPAGFTGDDSNTHLRYALDLVSNGFVSLMKTDGEAVVPEGAGPVPPVIDYSKAVDELITRLEWKA